MDEYFSEPSGILPNKLGIKDRQELEQAESEICFARMLELEVDPVEGDFDFPHLQCIHRRLFADIYDFAGKVRTINLAKDNSVFCRVEYIDNERRRIFAEIKKGQDLVGSGKGEVAAKLAYFASELNALHPFREGNGRAIRIFIQQLASKACFDLAYHDADPSELMKADILAHSGILEPLILLYSRILKPASLD